MLRDLLGGKTYEERQQERLLKSCGAHIDLYYACQERLANLEIDLASRAAFNDWINQEILGRTDGGRKQELARQLRRIMLALVMQKADNEALRLLVRLNELRAFASDKFFAGVILSEAIDCFVEPSSETSWVISTSFGYRQLVSDLLIVFRETITGRCKLDPYLHLSANLDLAVGSRPIAPYRFASIEHVAETEYMAMFAKLFVFAHEIGHVNAFKGGMRFRCDREEELYADDFAAELYLATTLMLVPPFDKYVASGKVSTVGERRALFEAAMQQAGTPIAASIGQNDVIHALRAAGLSGGEVEERRAAALTLQIWVVPLLLFRLFEQIERRLGHCVTHPTAQERIEQYWRKNPDDRMRRVVEHVFGPTIERIFGPSATGSCS